VGRSSRGFQRSGQEEATATVMFPFCDWRGRSEQRCGGRRGRVRAHLRDVSKADECSRKQTARLSPDFRGYSKAAEPTSELKQFIHLRIFECIRRPLKARVS
jgi:hypothetical protein